MTDGTGAFLEQGLQWFDIKVYVYFGPVLEWNPAPVDARLIDYTPSRKHPPFLNAYLALIIQLCK
jgi:hypothetical protein